MTTDFFGKKGMIWWKGVVEDRKDPLLMGRIRARMFGWHTKDKTQMPTEELPWCIPSQPLDHGNNVTGVKEGDWVWGFFLDDENAQHPVVVGFHPGIPEDEAIPELGFFDPTPDEELTAQKQPRPPSQSPIQANIEELLNSEGEEASGDVKTGRFGDPDKLPGQNSAFGVLTKDIEGNPNNPQNYKFDVDQDGTYTQTDADLLSWDINRNGILSDNELRNKQSGNYDRFVGYFDYVGGASSVTRYPLHLNEPTVSRLARNESIEETIVALKEGSLTTAATAIFSGAAFGTMEASVAAPFEEPEVPYDAEYPFNHVYESEAGHVIEIDDTPQAERLHRYHRSGTFEEVHPTGIKVDKIVDDQYNLCDTNSYHSSGESTVQTAGTEFRMKAGGLMVLESGAAMDFESGGNHNTVVGEDKNVVIKGDHWYFNAGEATLYIEESVKIFVKDKVSLRVEDDLAIDVKGDTALRGEGDIKIHSDKNIEMSANEDIKLSTGQNFEISSGKDVKVDASETMELKAEDDVTLEADRNMNIDSATTLLIQSNITEIRGPAYGGTMGVASAVAAGIAAPGTGVVPTPLFALPTSGADSANSAADPENDAEEYELEDVITASIQPGFILDVPKAGDLYKPISESDQKLVCLTPAGGPISLYHAVPTGDLETVEIQYLHEDLSITTWEVVRPVHTWEESGLIEQGRNSGFLEGRSVWRFTKPGKDYPKQMMMVGGTQDWLILDSAIRHD